MHKISLFVIGVLALCLVSVTAIAQTEKPGRYRTDTVLFLHGHQGSLGPEIFCNDQSAIKRFEVYTNKVLQFPIDVPDVLTIEPVFNTYRLPLRKLRLNFWEVAAPPYDWRLGAEAIVEQYILPVYNDLISRNQRIHIVAHSYGGIVARTLLAKVGDQRIGKVLFFGTPHWGLGDAYYGWNGGKISSAGVFAEIAGTVFLSHIMEGCGCSTERAVQFIRQGCSKFPRPVESLRELLPIYSFAHEGSLSGPRISPDRLCEMNDLLLDLDATEEPWNTPMRSHIFGSAKRMTTHSIALEQNNQACSRLLWPDGKPIKKRRLEVGDDRVIKESTCRATDVSLNDQCTLVDTVTSRKKPYEEKATAHQQLFDVYWEEMINFLLYSKLTKPATTTTSTTSTTLVVTTTTELDPTTTLPVTTTTIPDGSLAGVRIYPEEDGGLIYTQRFIYAFADADGGGVLDDDVSLHPNTSWSADDANIVQFYPDSGQMTYGGFQVGTTTIRVSFDPDGDGPKSPYTDAITVTIDDGTFGGG